MGGVLVGRRGFLLGSGLAGAAALTGAFGTGEAWAVEAPAIIGCDAWGARPSRVPVPVHDQRPVKILVHHTATPNSADLSREAADLLARNIQSFHMDRRGWLDTGQHFTISRGGVLLEGRHRSLEVLQGGERQVEGAHCTGQNVVAVGIENEGTYLDTEPTVELWDRLRVMCAYICTQYGIAPTEIYGHRDYKNTLCPGDRLYAMLPGLRSEVAALLGVPLERAAARKASWPLLRRGDRGATVTAAQYLLRAAGAQDLEAHTVFDATTEVAVRRFQAATGAEEVNGLLGGESWPVLAQTVHRGGQGDAQRAVEALAAARGTESVPDVVTAPVWQRLLGTGGAPMDLRSDPPVTSGVRSPTASTAPRRRTTSR